MSSNKVQECEAEIDKAYDSNSLNGISYSQALWTILSVMEDKFLKFTYIDELPSEQKRAHADVYLNALTHPLRSIVRNNNNPSTKIKHEIIDEHYGFAVDWLEKSITYILHAMKCNLMENLHASHEKSVLPILSELADEQLDMLQDKQQMIEFMMFLGHQIARTKAFRDGVLRAQPRRNIVEIEVANAMTHAWWFLSYMFGMNIGFSLYSSRHDTRHALLVNDTEHPFITSDQPIVNVHACISETEFSAPEHADFYYPISPRIAYIICDSKRFLPGKNQVDEATVTEFNTKVAAQAMVHIIGNTESAILPFQKHIGSRYASRTPFYEDRD